MSLIHTKRFLAEYNKTGFILTDEFPQLKKLSPYLSEAWVTKSKDVFNQGTKFNISFNDPDLEKKNDKCFQALTDPKISKEISKLLGSKYDIEGKGYVYPK